MIDCGAISALQLGLAPGGGAFVSYQKNDDDSNWIKSWDQSAGAWKVIREYNQQPLGRDSPPVLAVDSQGRPVIAWASQSDTWVGLTASRWNGSGWDSLAKGLPSFTVGFNSFDIAIDATDRPVLLLDQPSPPSGSKLTVYRWEGSTWVTLGVAPMNAKPAAFARLAVDSGDGVTPYVAYEPIAEDTTIIPLKFEAATTSWAPLSTLSRGLNLDFDIAVADGQMVLAYIDGASSTAAHVFLSTSGPSGWPPGTRLDADVDKPPAAVHLVTTGPGAQDLLLGWQAEVAPGKNQVFVKRAPTWSRVAGDAPLSAGDMTGFTLAAIGPRAAIVWSDRTGTPPFAGFLELSR